MKAKHAFLKKEQQQLLKKSFPLAPLIFFTITSLTVAIFSIADLEWSERISNERGTFLFVLGLVFFTCLFKAINELCLKTGGGQKLLKKYKITATDVMDISNKFVSAVQALFCCLTGLTICCYSCTRNMLRTSHYISEAYAWFGAAYFLYDIWSMYVVHVAEVQNVHQNGDAVVAAEKMHRDTGRFFNYLLKNPIIVVHHVFIGGFGFLFITYLRGGLGDCFFGFIYLMEASTPFVSLRGVLSKMGLKDSKFYIINGLIMLVVFFLCRVIMFPYVIYLYARSAGLDYFSAIKSLPTGCKISISILLYPQIYWFYLMVRGAVKVLKPKVKVTTLKKKQKNSHS